MQTTVPDDVMGVMLDEEVHAPLIADIDSVARMANIPVSMVWTSMLAYCGEEEIEYVRGLREAALYGMYGLVYVSDKPKKAVTNRMMSIAGACVRNYLDAMVMPLQEVLDCVKKGVMPDPTVLLIPNFFVGEGEGGKIADWQTSGLLSLLYSRLARGEQTFLYVRSLTELEIAYGAAFRQHVVENYKIVKE